jgi:hypothetical protein
LKNLAENGYETSKVYLILSMLYQQCDDAHLASKYKSLALVEYMRTNNMIDPTGNLK